MTKKENNPRPSAGKLNERETNDLGKETGSSTKIELSALEFEGEPVEFIESNGEKWYTGYVVGKIVGYPYKSVTQLYRRKREIFEGLAENHTVLLSGKLQSVLCFNRDGVLTFLNEVDWPSLEPKERRDKVIRFRKWMIKTVGEVIDGKYLPNLEKIEQLQGDYGDHSFLTGMVTKMIRGARKKYPGARCPSEQEIYQEDYNDVKGPGKLVPNWRKDLSQKQGKSLAVKKYFQGFQIWAGHLEREDIRRRVIADIDEFCPQNKPEFMPSLKQLDPTKQLELIGECDS